jgi:hypothetical protein
MVPPGEFRASVGVGCQVYNSGGSLLVNNHADQASNTRVTGQSSHVIATHPHL